MLEEGKMGIGHLAILLHINSVIIFYFGGANYSQYQNLKATQYF